MIDLDALPDRVDAKPLPGDWRPLLRLLCQNCNHYVFTSDEGRRDSQHHLRHESERFGVLPGGPVPPPSSSHGSFARFLNLHQPIINPKSDCIYVGICRLRGYFSLYLTLRNLPGVLIGPYLGPECMLYIDMISCSTMCSYTYVMILTDRFQQLTQQNTSVPQSALYVIETCVCTAF